MNKCISRILCVFAGITLLPAFAACSGNAIAAAEDFVPNKAPVIESVSSVRIDGNTNDPENLIANIPYRITVSAFDPEGQSLTYSFQSAQGSFSGQDAADSGVSVVFVTGILTANEEVTVTVTAKDPKTRNDVSTSEIRIGKAKSAPVITVTPLSITIARNGRASLSLSADCDGSFQLQCDNTITSASDVHIDDSENIFGYVSSGGTATATVYGPDATAGTDTSRSIRMASAGTWKVWVIFSDYLNQETAELCTVTVTD